MISLIYTMTTYAFAAVVIELQEQVRKLTQEVAQVRESTPRNPYWRVYNAHPINTKNSSSHEDFDDEVGRSRRL